MLIFFLVFTKNSDYLTESKLNSNNICSRITVKGRVNIINVVFVLSSFLLILVNIIQKIIESNQKILVGDKNRSVTVTLIGQCSIADSSFPNVLHFGNHGIFSNETVKALICVCVCYAFYRTINSKCETIII